MKTLIETTPSNPPTDHDGTVQNRVSGSELAQKFHLSHSPSNVFRHLAPTHKDYWKDRLEHRSYEYKGKLFEMTEYCVRLQHLGKRSYFGLDTSDKEVASAKARDIYVFLTANGWDATSEKFKPKTASQNKLTIGDYLAAVQGTAKLRDRTFLNYTNCFRSILAGVFGIKDSPTKFDYRTGGNQKWRARIDSIRLEKLTPPLVEKWMKRFVTNAGGASPAAIASAKRTANSYVRCARSLFSTALLKEASIKCLALPSPLPFAGVDLFEAGSSKYISKINVKTLVGAARRELKPKEPNVYKVFLLGLFAGMRKAEIDLCEWQMLDWANCIIRLEETEYLRLKTADSAGEITVDKEVLAELRTFKPASKSDFIVDSVVEWGAGFKKRTHVRQPRPDSARQYYRCEPAFDRLNEWLRGKGITANKPLHELRKEIGALIATEHGIFAAQTFLRHSDITTTARHYADHKARISVGLGKYLKSSLVVVKQKAKRQAG